MWRSSWMMPYLHIYKILRWIYNVHFSQGNVVINILAGGRTITTHRQIYGTLRATMGIPAAAASESLLMEQSDVRKLENAGSCREIGRPDEENYAAEVSSIPQNVNYGLKATAPDEFGTIVVDTSSLPGNPATFSDLLETSLKQWRKQVKLSKLYVEEVRRNCYATLNKSLLAETCSIIRSAMNLVDIVNHIVYLRSLEQSLSCWNYRFTIATTLRIQRFRYKVFPHVFMHYFLPIVW